MVSIIILLIINFDRLTISVFMFVCTIELIYDTTLYIHQDLACDNFIPNHDVLDQFVWLFQRFTADILWIVPIIYVFWPRHCWKKCCKTKKFSDDDSEASTFGDTSTLVLFENKSELYQSFGNEERER